MKTVNKFKLAFGTIIVIFIIIGLIFINSASFKRSVIDVKSDLTGGLNREINVYTADGQLIKHFEGKIDIDSENGVVKFDYNGKRYIYYNCFVETIGEL